jgi:hypothetical protein
MRSLVRKRPTSEAKHGKPMSIYDVRPFIPIDLPLIRRIASSGVSLDTPLALTRGPQLVDEAVRSAMLGVVPLADLGLCTYVLRNGESGYWAQFRHRPGEKHAQIVFLAPAPEDGADDSDSLRLIDALTMAAGRRGAQTLNAEIEENSATFTVLREAGFAVYSRGEIWRRLPAPLAKVSKALPKLLRPASEADACALNSLYLASVPRLVRQAEPEPEARQGWVCKQGERAVAYLNTHEGRAGITLTAMISNELRPDRVEAIVAAALARLPHAEKLPVYICLRRHQDWLGGALERLGFAPFANRALLARHTTRRVECALTNARRADGAALALHGMREYREALRAEEAERARIAR